MLAAIALGSNLPSRFGTPPDNLQEALRRMRDLGEVAAVSSFLETAPVGYADQPHFTNGAALFRTALGPLPLLRGLLGVERSMGRERSADQPPKGPRVIDLDLLLYEDEDGHGLVLADPDLVLPHPEMHRRAFVLQPLVEIAPAMRHPVLGESAETLLRVLSGSGGRDADSLRE